MGNDNHWGNVKTEETIPLKERKERGRNWILGHLHNWAQGRRGDWAWQGGAKKAKKKKKKDFMKEEVVSYFKGQAA